MLKFRSSRDSLRDARVAYSYLIILALVLAVTGLIASQLRQKLEVSELVIWRDTLAECSDSLGDYVSSTQAQDRLAAALRFENAASKLACSEDARSELLRLASVMRENASPERIDPSSELSIITGLAGKFSSLATLDYASSEAARTHVSGVLDTLFATGLAGESQELSEEKSDSEGSNQLELYQRQRAAGAAQKLLGKTLGLLAVENSRESYVAKADNVRATFSMADGTVESLLYIRLGTVPEETYTEEELAVLARTLICETLGEKDADLTLTRLETFCGFTTVEHSTDKVVITIVYDASGRLWTLEKAKR